MSMPRCRASVRVLKIPFSTLSMLPSVQPLLGNSLNSLHALHPLTDRDFKQELRYRKQIAHQLRTQYVEGIYDNPVTLKW